MRRFVLSLALIMMAFPARALDLNTPFDSIDGGTLKLSQWHGQPVLVVNTASRCAFTKQYSGLQALYDAYRDQGLVVVAVPSNDFRQELSSNEQVKDYCELQYGIDMPMTVITPITGPEAHPFFRSLKRNEGFAPNWNFNKVLIGPDGNLVATYRSLTKPTSPRLRRDIESLLR